VVRFVEEGKRGVGIEFRPAPGEQHFLHRVLMVETLVRFALPLKFFPECGEICGGRFLKPLEKVPCLREFGIRGTFGWFCFGLV